DSDLFIEPEIDANFRAIDSIDFSLVNPYLTDLIFPMSIGYIKDYDDFFFDYSFEKQNNNGSFSDINGLGNIFSTYEVIEIIDLLNPNYLNSKSDEIGKILTYIQNCLLENGWGFKFNEYAPLPDIISTYCAIHLANRFNAKYILSNPNITTYVSTTTWAGESLEQLYYRIKAYLELGQKFNQFQNDTIKTYLKNLKNLDGGYSYTGVSNVQSTFYAISSMFTLNITPEEANETLQFILNCANFDGGFGLTPYINSSSDFISGWAAMKSIDLLKDKVNLPGVNIEGYRQNYYNWLYTHQAKNGLFGHITLDANYLGVLSISLVEPEEFTDHVDIDNVWDFVEDCYNKEEGGFSSQPGGNASLLATYYAINLYEILLTYSDISLPDINDTIDYLVNLQNFDGGFELGIDINEFLSLFGPLGQIFTNLIKTDIPIMESTYWAVASLKILEALDDIDIEDLINWISAAQNADGGFPIVLGFHSDTISTYFGLKTFKVLDMEPMSKIAAIEFLKNAQAEDGSFIPIPAISDYFELPSSFLITYFAAMGLYEYDFQPEDIKELIDWYEDCLSSNTGGVGDFPSFGGDLRNTPYGIILIDELKYDQKFNPNPWNDLITTIFLFEMLFIILFGIIKIIFILNVTISKKLKERFGVGDKFNISYLQKFPAIRCDSVNIYAGRTLIVNSVSMKLKHGEILGVLGESGAGKSTFVKSLLGMRKYTGTIQIYGMNVKKKYKKMRPIYGYVPQDLGKIYQNFTTLQNILYFGKQYDLEEKEILQKAKRILSALEIEDKMNEKVKNLSGGQKRRVSIAMALIHDPIIVWMDEPTSGLDPVVRENLWLTLTKINEQFSTTLIVVTHYPEESRFCHRVAIFGRNRGMMDFGKPKDLLVDLPGKGRTVELYFEEIQENVADRLESIEGIEKALENKVGTDFALLSDLNLNSLYDKIQIEFGVDTIKNLKQRDSLMEEYFRYLSMEIPKIE
ncbi:MAG: ATP-binding cassette domain-containing protein, partial [Promethearchaeota archaeon]